MRFIELTESDTYTQINVDNIVLFYKDKSNGKTIIQLSNDDEIHVEESEDEVRRSIGFDFFDCYE